MLRNIVLAAALALPLYVSACQTAPPPSPEGAAANVTLFPASGAKNVNPDTHLVLTFSAPPTIGETGKIRIYDSADNSLADELDLSIPTSPNPSGRGAAQTAGQPLPPGAVQAPVYQVTKVGGADYHFRPIIVRDNTATIYPHNNALKYGRTYIVKIESAALRPTTGAFPGLQQWTFTTKAAPPAATSQRVTVSADGKADFSTLQAALDFFPAKSTTRREIFIRNGNYEEIIYFADKANLTIRGESRDKTIVGYANNTPFAQGTGKRWAFGIQNGENIQLSNFTINNYAIGQAEALMIRGSRNVLDRMTLNGSGDALTTYGSMYMQDSKLTGHGDTILGYATLFCLRCEVHSIGPITWTRTPEGIHGNVFVDSKFYSIEEPLPWTVTAENPAGQRSRAVFARLPKNGPVGAVGANFPHAEMVVINSKTQGVPADGWGPVEGPPDFDSSKVRFMEFNTTDMAGQPIDLSQRHPIAKKLDAQRDSALIANYQNPEWVLGWKPEIR